MCGEEGPSCARCRLDFYCGKEHQLLDWPRHKRGCGALELRLDQRLGRHLVAAKDIPAGTVLIRERPAFLLPSVHHWTGSKVMEQYRKSW